MWNSPLGELGFVNLGTLNLMLFLNLFCCVVTELESVEITEEIFLIHHCQIKSVILPQVRAIVRS